MIGFYLARNAMLVQQSRLEIVANNLANQETVGFKRDEPVQQSFAELLVHQINNLGRGVGAPAGKRPVGVMAHNVALGGVFVTFTGGELLETGRKLDFALEGAGFFQVQSPDGFLFTRNGRFFLDEERRLVTVEGYPVWGENGPLVINDLDGLTVTEAGVLYARHQELGRLLLPAFSGGALQKVGGNYFAAREDAAGWIATARVRTGFLEGSNVDMTGEMAKLLEIRRNFEASQKVVSAYERILSKAANELGTLN